ncbi:MAG: flavodoxin family protein [Verrucomicrobia bacterium]|nr:flavodoxin family protein [Verrucomicrobiota bacterium]
MKQIAIVYFSGSGHTQLMAEAAHRGASSITDVTAELLPVDGRDIVGGRFQNEALLQKLKQADAIIFGTPTYMGGVAAQFKAFVDATGGIWFAQEWKNKIAAGFTHSGSLSGDKLSTLQYLSLFAAQHGMVWIGNAHHNSIDGMNRLGSYLGVMGATAQPTGTVPEVNAGDIATMEALGRRVGNLSQELKMDSPPN